ncbi:hypothetical protein, partial [Klebsiella pneumoniae]
VLDIYSSLSLIWRYSYCLVFQGATSPESEKFVDSDGRLIASGLWQQQRLRKLANYRQEEPE